MLSERFLRPVSGTAVDAGTPLRLVTLNSWKCDGQYALRLQAMTNQLRALAPDVVALQESFSSVDGRHDTARSLAQALDLNWVVVPARCKTRECDGQKLDSHSGLALLSRWPIYRQAVLPLPGSPEDGERLALLCQINAEQHPLTVANVHLTHLRDAHALRHRQMHTVLDHSWMHAPRDIALVCGDFNASLGSDSLRAFVTPSGSWVDAARAAGLAGKVTCPDGGSGGVDLDHVLSRAAARVRWTAASVVLDHPDVCTGVLPSDHFAVCLDGQLLP